MLQDITLVKNRGRILDSLAKGHRVLWHQTGVYRCPHFNFEHEVVEDLVRDPFDCFERNIARGLPVPFLDENAPWDTFLPAQWVPQKDTGWFTEEWKCAFPLQSYGVTDSIKQVLQWALAATQHPRRRFVISLTEVRKETQPSSDGWRWGGWGHYIGAQMPTREYLADEPIIEVVHCFNINEIE